ncbi:serine--tRNA ligase [Fulvivirga sediminis]|uniref:Serine--tRNA ligase n=1 Tax=Fulvivirga sediminis TaxID=2803949 RepID=A0A937K153_9BACT|nr:serine--tRNA ligase [Fulvivirga sediminis]MBL3656980.1 serine--tRNA ligase [Fulvivirga sediminis]
MLQVTYIRENKDQVIAGLGKRKFANAEDVINEVLELDDLRKSTQQKHDEAQSESNALSKEIGTLMKAGKKDEAEEIKQKTADLKVQVKDHGERLTQYESDLKALLYKIPNVPNNDVPEGAGENDNVTVEQHGDVPELFEGALPHWELIKKYDIIDFELGNKITGAGFPVYRGKGARLQRSLVNYFLDKAVEAGYMEVQPPILINEESGYGTGQLPDKDGQMYFVREENFYLIPTAEVPITNMYRDVIVNSDDLPIKHVGFTPCFRREAGSWGAHVRGLNRLHQFDKVEIVEIHHPDDSYAALERMCNHVKGLLESLNLPYRVLNLCGADLSFTSAQTFDMEVFSAAQQKWLEVSSVSNFETYQANRLKLRCKGKDNKSFFLHTLNGSALALPRILAAILENNQTEDGIKIPEVLVPYTGFDSIN